jgi:hypothetical protein
MNYEDRLSLVKSYLPDAVGDLVKKHYLEYEDQEGFFSCWVSMDASFEIPDLYIKEFKKRFGIYITSSVEEDIRLVASTVPHFIKAYIDVQEGKIRWPRMVRLVRAMVKEQVEDFGNWCNTVCLSIPDEEEMD